MAVNPKEDVKRADAVSKFTDRITNYVEATTPFQASTGVFNTNMGNASGGQVQQNKRPADMQTSDLEDFATANSSDVLNVLTAIRNFLKSTEFNHVVRFQNTGNLGGNQQGIARLNTTHGINMDSDINSAFASSGVSPKKRLDATEYNNLIEACRGIWDTRCRYGGNKQTYYYNYCHSNFSNFGSHGSRGRR
jgi:hypothetical protein